MPYVQKIHPGYIINVGILNWSVYTRTELKCGLAHIKNFETNNVKVDHWSDFCNLVDFEWNKDDYYEYMRNFGKMIGKS